MIDVFPCTNFRWRGRGKHRRKKKINIQTRHNYNPSVVANNTLGVF